MNANTTAKCWIVVINDTLKLKYIPNTTQRTIEYVSVFKFWLIKSRFYFNKKTKILSRIKIFRNWLKNKVVSIILSENLSLLQLTFLLKKNLLVESLQEFCLHFVNISTNYTDYFCTYIYIILKDIMLWYFIKISILSILTLCLYFILYIDL